MLVSISTVQRHKGFQWRFKTARNGNVARALNDKVLYDLQLTFLKCCTGEKKDVGVYIIGRTATRIQTRVYKAYVGRSKKRPAQ